MIRPPMVRRTLARPLHAGAVPIRAWPVAAGASPPSVQVLLITNRAGEWIVPKGHVERGRNAAWTAAQECLEEAGVSGVLSAAPVGDYQHHADDAGSRVQVFVLHVQRVLARWEEEDERTRRWMSVEHAAARVTRSGRDDLAELIRRAARQIGESRGQGGTTGTNGAGARGVRARVA